MAHEWIKQHGKSVGIAIVALIPFNYLNARLENARHEIEDASTRLELLLRRPERKPT